jgi:hypothetical protein
MRDAPVPAPLYNRAIPFMTETAPLAQYTFRKSVLEQPRTYSLYADKLVIEGNDLSPRIYYLDEVVRVRLKYEHSKQREYYQCFVQTKRGTVRLHHLSWSGFASFDDQRASYTPFVRALLAQLATQPNVRFRAGSIANFIAAILGLPLMAGMAALAIHFDRSASATLASFMFVLCLMMLGRSRPRRFDPLAPPGELLPE